MNYNLPEDNAIVNEEVQQVAPLEEIVKTAPVEAQSSAVASDVPAVKDKAR